MRGLKFLHVLFGELRIEYLTGNTEIYKLTVTRPLGSMNNSRRIIIVDDDSVHLLVSKLILERRGYEVLTLKDCDELIDRISSFTPALIFMDHHMPAMTGIEATKLIKSAADCKDIPVVYFTSREDIKELAAQAGADDWLRKPFMLDDLVKKTGEFFSVS
jgi:CheY-like chemotaxis protein